MQKKQLCFLSQNDPVKKTELMGPYWYFLNILKNVFNVVGREEVKGFFTQCQLKNVEGLIKLYNIYFATTDTIMDTSKDHQ